MCHCIRVCHCILNNNNNKYSTELVNLCTHMSIFVSKLTVVTYCVQEMASCRKVSSRNIVASKDKQCVLLSTLEQ